MGHLCKERKILCLFTKNRRSIFPFYRCLVIYSQNGCPARSNEKYK